MNKKVVFFAVLLVILVSFAVYAADKKDSNSLNKIKLDPTTLKEKKPATDVAPEKATVIKDFCDTLYYHGDPYYYWPIPDAYGDDFFNERFDIPYDCYLKEIRIAFYEGGSSGNPDAFIYVWNSDGMYPLDPAPPSGAIAEFVIPNSELVWYPEWNVVETEMVPLNLTGGEPIHVGYSHPKIDIGDTLSILSDDGSQASTRSIEYYNGAWGTMLDDWGTGVDFLIQIVVCPPELGCCQLIEEDYPVCMPATEEECDLMGGAWFPPPATCQDSFCIYPDPVTTIVEPNDTCIWDKNYFSDTLTIQAVDFQPMSRVVFTDFYYFDGVWHWIWTDMDGSTYWQDPMDTLQPGGDGWQAKWDPSGLPEGYYMIRADMYNAPESYSSDTIVQYYDPYPPEVNIIFPEVFNFPSEIIPLDIYFSSPGDNITEMYITVCPVPDYPVAEGVEMEEREKWCLIGYNKGVPHFNQHNLYPNGKDGKNRGCSPTAMAACLKYWANNGYPCLNKNGAMTDKQMVTEIAGYAGTNPNTGTKVKAKKPALDKYIKKHCGECVFQPVKHLQGKSVTLARLLRELWVRGEDVITGDKNHVTVVNSFCLLPPYIDYMDPWTGTEKTGPWDVSKGFSGNPLIELVIVSPKDSTAEADCYTVATTPDIEEIEPGTYHYPWYPDPELFPVGHGYMVNVEITDALGHKGWDMVKVELFLRGDANGDGVWDLGDVVFLINYLYKGDPPPFPLDAGDANCDGVVDLGDVVYLINYLFRGGDPPGCD